MPDTDRLKVPLFDMAHVGAREIDQMRSELTAASSYPYPTLRRFTPWALGLLFVVLGALAVKRYA